MEVEALGRSRLARDTGGVELQYEHRDAVGLVGLSDCCGHLLQPTEATKEAAVRVVRPADVARAAPLACSSRIESAVIAHAIGGIALDVVASHAAECRPREQRTRIGHHDLRD